MRDREGADRNKVPTKINKLINVRVRKQELAHAPNTQVKGSINVPNPRLQQAGDLEGKGLEGRRER